MLEDAPVHHSELGYAMSKRLLAQHMKMIDRENWCCLFPVNIYGPYDNFSLKTGHVVPMLIHKFYKAVQNNSELVQVWGDGLSLREFIHVEDLCEMIWLLMTDPEPPESLIVSSQKAYNIRQISEMLQRISGFQGEIFFNKDKPNGLRGRECKSIREHFIHAHRHLLIGLRETYQWFTENYEEARK